MTAATAKEVEIESTADRVGLAERLIRFSVVNDKTGCWDWIGAKTSLGYGFMTVSWQGSVERRTIKAHRVAYAVFCGNGSAGLCLCHRCDNPGCINPAHLFPGTDAANARDRRVKGRSNYAVGVRAANVKYSEQQVRQVLEMTGQYKEISAATGMTVANIANIKTGRNWTHVAPEIARNAPRFNKNHNDNEEYYLGLRRR